MNVIEFIKVCIFIKKRIVAKLQVDQQSNINEGKVHLWQLHAKIIESEK